MKKGIVGLLFFFIFLFALSAEQRTALVIGNSDYKSSPLKNPANDAQDMAAELEELGFSVTELIVACLGLLPNHARHRFPNLPKQIVLFPPKIFLMKKI